MSAATDLLSAYQAAELAVLKGQSYSMNGRQLTLANLKDIREGKAAAQRAVDAEVNAAAGRRSGILFADFSGN